MPNHKQVTLSSQNLSLKVNRGTVKHFAFNMNLGERTNQQEVFHKCGIPVRKFSEN